METTECVVIIGGGPVGLTTSIALSQKGIPHTLLEKNPSTTTLPRSIGINMRSMEYFRSLGLEQEILQHAAPPETHSQTSWHTSLGPEGKEICTRDAWGGGQYRDEYARASPSRFTMLTQLRLEPILHRTAKRLNPEGIINGARVVAIEELPEGVKLQVQHATGDSSQTTRTIRAKYAIAADGGQFVPGTLGIEMEGEKDVMNMVSAYMQAPISEVHPSQNSLITWFINPLQGGSIKSGALYHLGPYPLSPATEEWVFLCALLPNDPTTFDKPQMMARIRETLRIPGLEFTIKSINHWRVNSVVAERFRSPNGRIFLVGDSAHRVSPWGALGLNTGVQDVQNLIWKLTVALEDSRKNDNRSYETLLNSYEEERRPIAVRNAETCLFSMRAHSLAMDHALGIRPETTIEDNLASLERFFDRDDEEGNHLRAAVADAQHVLDSEFHAIGLEMGWFYPSLDTQGEGDSNSRYGQIDPDGKFDILNYHPSAIPGHHVPHIWVDHVTKATSTRDLVMNNFTLLAVDKEWSKVKTSTVKVFIIPRDSPGTIDEWKGLCRLGDRGAVLARPDGIVLWKFRGDDPETAIFMQEPDAFIKRLLNIST